VKRAVTLLGLALALLARTARAEDDKADALTLLPWSDTTLTIGAKEKRAVVQYTQLTEGGFGVHVKASAPLDEDSHIASFTDKNRLTSGFAARVQFGLDTRARRLALLEAATRDVADAVKQLSSKAPVTDFGGWRAAYAKDLGLPNGTTLSEKEALIELCKGVGIAAKDCTFERSDEAECAAGVSACVAQKLCSTHLAATCTTARDLVKVGHEYWDQSCTAIGTDAARHASCVVAGPIRYSLEMQARVRALDRVLGDAALVGRIVKIYKHVATKVPDECLAEKTEVRCIVENAETIAGAIRGFVTTAPLERRDLLMFALQDQQDVAALISASLSYDRALVYSSDIASSADEETQYDLQIGPDLTWFTPVRGLSANLRLGYERSRSLDAEKFQRCVAQTSSDPTVTGTRCDANALLRTGPSPEASSSMYVRAAVDYQFNATPERDTIVPGVELRGGFDGIGAAASFGGRVSLFATPVKGTTAARVGVALDLRHDFERDPGTPSWIVTPLVFVGATFTDLMGR